MRYGVVGSGYRTEAFVRIAERMPERFTLEGVVTRTETRVDEIVEDWQVPAYTDLGTFLEHHPVDFMITSTPHAVTPSVIGDLVAREIPVLAETPPAPDVDGLRALWKNVGASGLVQVAEQYPYAPGNAARRALLETGALGDPTWAYVSSTQTYHAVALLRHLLGVEFEPARVSAQQFELPVVDPQTRAGWADDLEPQNRRTTLATLDFGGRVGVYDYTDNQVRNPIRGNRMLVRGTHGELADDQLTRLAAPKQPLRSELTRWQTGEYLSFEERDLYQIGDGERVLYRNPYFGARLSEEEIAVATLLERTGHWVRDGGEPPYPLAQAAQDQLLALAIAESARNGSVVQTEREDWAG
ncbi:Gfo/Idh/MocA family oxidoreductase [Microlunatus elymi]|uniref:Gfo/Idh/MocA family oxidoreductase n=1 Tax=Microlunatus elymi TaxID=2596828 RepID=A0A516Q517_9ACTN|nr:Gfo/Idh/MocA family oxidoreductase [Microlunatus elymi]